ncbi:hypothetical protein BJ508DRAFT_310468 [Ascobolus immersus RN42]|uniref:Uncharacterized protein n=1 Tax=Ascobolus immersus RN42 TaxID=1160509 RepID=A0A3N4I5E8_ASCIM|nr:hypothetical protein BJ508DRAFT_310468 [Ascobolus immersus RN42]
MADRTSPTQEKKRRLIYPDSDEEDEKAKMNNMAIQPSPDLTPAAVQYRAFSAHTTRSNASAFGVPAGQCYISSNGDNRRNFTDTDADPYENESPLPGDAPPLFQGPCIYLPKVHEGESTCQNASFDPMLCKDAYPGVLPSNHVYQASLRMNFHGSWGIFLNVGGHNNGLSGAGAGWIAPSDEGTLVPLLSSNHRVLGTIRWERQSKDTGRGMVFFGSFEWRADFCSVYGLPTIPSATDRQAIQLPLMDTSIPDQTDPYYRSAMSSVFDQIALERKMSEERQAGAKESPLSTDAEVEQDEEKRAAGEVENGRDSANVTTEHEGTVGDNEEAESESEETARLSMLSTLRVVSGSAEITPGLFDPDCLLLHRLNEK